MSGLDPVELLREMLLLPSPSGEEAGLARALVARMEGSGFRAALDPAGNALGRRGGGPRLGVLLGHLDTVPGVIPVREAEGRLHGRGAVDAKGPLAAMVAAASAVEVPQGWTLLVVGAVEEEAPSSRGARQLAAELRPQWALVGEPSGWERITLGYRGRVRGRLRFDREQAHGAAPEPTAVEEAVEAWLLLRDQARSQRGPSEFYSLSARLQALNSGEDGLRQWAVAEVSWRLPPGWEPERLEDEVGRVLEGRRVELWGQEPPYLAPRNTPVVRALLAGIRAEGGRPGLSLKTGTSDMNVVGPSWNCPIAAYGPGDSSLDHTPHEHLEVAELRRATAVLRHALERLMQADERQGPSPRLVR